MSQTNQEGRHVGAAGAGTKIDYNSQFSAMFDAAGFTTGDWNGRLLRWINNKLSASYTNLPAAQAAYALAIGGVANWNALNTVTP